jgi:hypothetical protein
MAFLSSCSSAALLQFAANHSSQNTGLTLSNSVAVRTSGDSNETDPSETATYESEEDARPRKKQKQELRSQCGGLQARIDDFPAAVVAASSSSSQVPESANASALEPRHTAGSAQTSSSVTPLAGSKLNYATMPRELLWETLQYLEPYEKIKIRSVYRAWNEASKKEASWYPFRMPSFDRLFVHIIGSEINSWFTVPGVSREQEHRIVYCDSRELVQLANDSNDAINDVPDRIVTIDCEFQVDYPPDAVYVDRFIRSIDRVLADLTILPITSHLRFRITGPAVEDWWWAIHWYILVVLRWQCFRGPPNILVDLLFNQEVEETWNTAGSSSLLQALHSGLLFWKRLVPSKEEGGFERVVPEGLEDVFPKAGSQPELLDLLALIRMPQFRGGLQFSLGNHVLSDFEAVRSLYWLVRIKEIRVLEIPGLFGVYSADIGTDEVTAPNVAEEKRRVIESIRALSLLEALKIGAWKETELRRLGALGHQLQKLARFTLIIKGDNESAERGSESNTLVSPEISVARTDVIGSLCSFPALEELRVLDARYEKRRHSGLSNPLAPILAQLGSEPKTFSNLRLYEHRLLCPCADRDMPVHGRRDGGATLSPSDLENSTRDRPVHGQHDVEATLSASGSRQSFPSSSSCGPAESRTALPRLERFRASICVLCFENDSVISIQQWFDTLITACPNLRSLQLDIRNAPTHDWLHQWFRSWRTIVLNGAHWPALREFTININTHTEAGLRPPTLNLAPVDYPGFQRLSMLAPKLNFITLKYNSGEAQIVPLQSPAEF